MIPLLKIMAPFFLNLAQKRTATCACTKVFELDVALKAVKKKLLAEFLGFGPPSKLYHSLVRKAFLLTLAVYSNPAKANSDYWSHMRQQA